MSKVLLSLGHKDETPNVHATGQGLGIKDRQFQKMNALGNLMCGMAHDLNNILTSIIGFTELAELSEPHRTGPHLQGVTKAANRGQALVQQILLLGSQGEQEPKPINLPVVIPEVLSLLRVSLPKNITIDLGRAVQSSFVMADPIQISQILMNLCLNGVHAMGPAGGVLEVSLFEVMMNRENMKHYPELTPGPFMRLRVRDAGSGIPQHVLERMFDPFFTTKKPGEGTGMGLAVVQDIVTRHRGMISVDSVLGQGTVIDVYLPRIPEEIQDAKKVPVGEENKCIFVKDEISSVSTFRKIGRILSAELSLK